MARSWGFVLAFVLLGPALAGCLGDDWIGNPDLASTPEGPSSGFPTCEHPFPCADGTEWPANLTGPFEILPPENVDVESFDGTPIHGVVWRPDLPDGAKAPVVLNAGPYKCQSSPCADDPLWMDTGQRFGELVEAGYAVAIFNVRGTGQSGGCFDLSGPDERQDQVEVVNWLADQPWSNGRVAMYGISYMGTTPWLAAVESPSALKTIVPLGIITDWYTESHSPQGAVETAHGEIHTARGFLDWGFTPGFSITKGPAWATHAPEKTCEDGLSSMTEIEKGAYTGQRDAAFWEERRTLDELENVTAATFVVHGLHDPQAFQEDPVWQGLTDAPKRMMLGQWGHEFPNGKLDGAPGEDDWSAVLTDWLDFWLKGLGEPPRVGVVDYQDSTGVWHNTTAWPPAQADREVLHLSQDALAPEPEPGQRSFVSHPAARSASVTCQGTSAETVCQTGPASWLTYAAQPAEQTVQVAGNPMAYLNLSSDQPGGIVTVELVDAAPEAPCLRPSCEGVDEIAKGAADLRFHHGDLEGRDFPTGEPTHVRVDLTNLAHLVEPGHRLGLHVSHGDVTANHAQPGYTPKITVHGGDGPEASHVILPLGDGSLGGMAPVVDYPPRPFTGR